MSSILVLPWPPSCLSPNSRKDRRSTSGIRKQCRQTCKQLTKRSGFLATHLDITFCPPDRRRRDLDNMLASAKSHLDGVADGMKIDDHEFVLTIRKGAPVKGGQVIIRDGGTHAAEAA